MEYDKERVKRIHRYTDEMFNSTACRRLTPLELARDILSVQPFPNNDNIIGSIVRQNKTPTD